MHGIDVEPVPRCAGRGRQWLLTLTEGDVVLAVPLEEHLAGPDVDLLHHAVDDRLVGGTAYGGEVGGGSGVREDQRGVPRSDEELVAIGRQSVAGVDGRDLLVVVVVDVVGPSGETSEAGPLPPGKDRLPVVGLGPEIGCRLTRRDRVEPDDLTRRLRISGPLA